PLSTPSSIYTLSLHDALPISKSIDISIARAGALSRGSLSTRPGSSAFAEATADRPNPATASSASGPRPVSSTQARQSPFGSSPKIFSPQFSQTLDTNFTNLHQLTLKLAQALEPASSTKLSC